MKILIYSDVHGNLPAFEKMISLEKDIYKYICLGDLVNYGPWSNECVDLAVSLPNSTLILGNHEEAFINGLYPGTNPLVQDFFKATFSKFNKFETIKKFQIETKLDNFICRHTIGNIYIYPDTDLVLDKNYIIGHSHHQFKYINNNFILYNTGSFGKNRMFINELNYLVYDSNSKSIELKSAIYDLNVVINEMKNLAYPKNCIDYYVNKKKK